MAEAKLGIIEALKQDHQSVRALIKSIESARDGQRKELFQRLVNDLVRHEVAEEEILRPISKRIAGESVANARIKEESKAEEVLKELEKIDPASNEFMMKFKQLAADVEHHAQAEETEEFPKVEKGAGREELERMAKAFEVAKAVAPTHPHPSTPNTPAANLALGPFAAVLDRTRDAVRNALKGTGQRS